MAATLHAQGRSHHGRAWGWEVTYEPEIREAAAQVDVPDGRRRDFTVQTMPAVDAGQLYHRGKRSFGSFSLAWEDWCG